MMIIWESSGSHLGAIWESSGGHLGDSWESFGSHLATQEAPEGTQEAPGGTQEARDILESECVISYAPAHKSDASDHFRVHGSDVTITV